MKHLIFLLCFASPLAFSADFDWTDVKTPNGLTPQELSNFELGVVTSSTLLCNYYDLYSQLNLFTTDVIMFEKGKASLVRETKKISTDDCKRVLAAASVMLTR